MAKSIKEIIRPIKEEFKNFQQYFNKSLHSDVFLINTIVKYIIGQKSKKLRPILVLMSSKICGGVNEKTYLAASLVEILHTASLLHDDVVDEAETRRGLPSINAIWKNKISVLMGDYLFARALINMVHLEDFRALQLLSDTAEQLSSGEILQIEKSSDDTMDERVYFRMIERKTASLFAAACKLGALSVTEREDYHQALYDYGLNVGIAFQIKDDLFDYMGDEIILGKPIGRDVKENLVTLPLIYTYATLPKSESKRIKKILKRGPTRREIREISELVEQCGGIDYAMERIDEYSTRAAEALQVFPSSELKDSLLYFTEFNKFRKK